MRQVPTPDAELVPLRVSTKAIGHLGKGLYRTPAGAIKELISNAWDARATRVEIRTNFPHFTRFECIDNGTGMSKSEFDRFIDQGIGWSDKRTAAAGKTATSGRPLIGRLGIGLMAVAHLCTKFTLTSYHRTEPFAVEIRFRPSLRRALDSEEPREEEDSQSHSVEAGDVRWLDAPVSKSQRGLVISSESVLGGFTTLMSEVTDESNTDPHTLKLVGPVSFVELVDKIYRSRAVDRLSQYESTLFHLAMYPPLPYIGSEKTNLLHRLDAVREHDAAISKWKFCVEVDGLELRRPVQLPAAAQRTHPYAADDCRNETRSTEVIPLGRHGGISLTELLFELAVPGPARTVRLYELNYESDSVGGQPLRFSGYLFAQVSRLYPSDLQGILIRIRDVAVGEYDQSLMSYPTAEGPRFSMITSEIWVHEGLEDALNIDREGFDRMHPHYRRIRECLHAVLGKVFPGMWEEEKRANREYRSLARDSEQRDFLKALGLSGAPDAQRLDFRDSPAAESHSPYDYDPDTKTIWLNSADPAIALIPRHVPRRTRSQAALIALAYESTRPASATEVKRRQFYEHLVRILGGKSDK